MSQLQSLLLTLLIIAATATASADEGGNAASASTILGRWASSSSGGTVAGTGLSTGSSKRQYQFAAAGTYTFRMEAWGGHLRPDEWYVVEESGTYGVNGNQLTIRPSATRGVVRGRGEVRQTVDVPLEEVTYTWQTHYFEGLDETNLVLTPPAPTMRDGEFASNETFPSSYLLSASYQPEWEF